MTYDSQHFMSFNPGNTFANIPGSLGYHPNDCLVVFIFHCAEDYGDGGRYQLGPVLRTDVTSVAESEEFLHYVRGFEPDLMFVAAIGGSDAVVAGLEFETQCVVNDVPLLAVWHIPELYSGAPYERIGGESWSELGAHNTGSEHWDCGVVGEILAAPAMEAFRRRGELPELTREESFAFFSQPNPLTTKRDRRQLSKQGKQHARALLQTLQSSEADEAEYMLQSLLDDFQDAVDSIVHQQLSVDEICQDMDLIEQCVVYFSHPNLRDTLLHWAVSDYAYAFFSLSVAIARSTSLETRSHALCCAAMAACYSGHKHRVSQALQLAYDNTPRHRLTLLMLEALHCGGLELLYQACHEGSNLARAALLSS